MDSQFKSYWESALKMLEGHYTPVSFDTMIKPLEPLEMANGYFTFVAPEKFIKETVEHRYGKEIEKKLVAITGNDYKIRFYTRNELTKQQNDSGVTENSLSKSNLNGKYVFTSFVKGKSNELAYAASVAVADNPGLTMYNPLFLYGGVGLGKTHLMHSIGNYVLEQSPLKRVLYTTTESFTNEFITALIRDRNQAFRDKFRDIDVLLIDDIQFLSDKEGTQEELFHTFNALYNANKQIVISSDQPPKELKTIEERLTSRFGNGLIVDITLPDIETRIAILKKKAEIEGVEVPSEVTRFIAKNVVSNIRELEGALTKVIAFSRLGSTDITLEMTEALLKDLISGREKREITIAYIQEVTAKYFNITVEEIIGKRRTANIVYPRQIAMYLCRKLTDSQSLLAIGREFGGRDHSTIIYGSDKIAAELEKDNKLKETLIELEKIIRGTD